MTDTPTSTVAGFTVTLAAPEWDATDFDQLSEIGQAVVGHAYRYVGILGERTELGEPLPSLQEDSRQRAAWRKATRTVPRHERDTVRLMLSDAMGAVHAIRTARRDSVPMVS